MGIVAVGILSASTAGGKPKFMQCCYFGEISGQYFAKYFPRIIWETLLIISNNTKYWVICDDIETNGKHAKYVKYLLYWEIRRDILCEIWYIVCDIICKIFSWNILCCFDSIYVEKYLMKYLWYFAVLVFQETFWEIFHLIFHTFHILYILAIGFNNSTYHNMVHFISQHHFADVPVSWT